MAERRTRRQFTNEFKAQAVKRLDTSKYPLLHGLCERDGRLWS